MKCVIRIGKVGREDPDTEVRIVKKINGEVWSEVERAFVQGKKKMEFDLDEGEYHAMVVGNKIAGVATTAEMDMTFPFNVHLDPPRDHSKDYQRISVPARPTLDLKAAIRKVLH